MSYLPVAARYWARTSAGIRPRSLTSRSCALAQMRTSMLLTPLVGALRPFWVARVVPVTLSVPKTSSAQVRGAVGRGGAVPGFGGAVAGFLREALPAARS